jgi:hypothetical protein
MKEFVSARVWEFIAWMIVVDNPYDILSNWIFALLKESAVELSRQHRPTHATISQPAMLCKYEKLHHHEMVTQLHHLEVVKVCFHLIMGSKIVLKVWSTLRDDLDTDSFVLLINAIQLMWDTHQKCWKTFKNFSKEQHSLVLAARCPYRYLKFLSL